jgi:hypothetical protein
MLMGSKPGRPVICQGGRIMSRRLSWIAVFATALLFLGTMPVGAVGPFGTPQVLLGAQGQPTCEPSGDGDAAIATDGATRGFARCNTTQIWFFYARPGSAPLLEPSPYAGQVLSVAWDGVEATYVLFLVNDELRIGKRVEARGAAYAPATTLSTRAQGALGDVVASAGHWWAVWSELTDPGTPGAGIQLYQRHTLLGVQGRTRITNTASNVTNEWPTLAYASGRVTMVWSRQTDLPQPGAASRSDLWMATSTGGAWSSRLFASLGQDNQQPDVTIYGGVTWVTWARDARTVIADNAGGTFHSRAFATAGFDPTVAVSGSHVFVAWYAIDADRAFLAERSGGLWTGAQVYLSPSIPLRVLAQGTKARVIYEATGGVYIRTQT